MRGPVATVLIKAQTEYAAHIAAERMYPELGYGPHQDRRDRPFSRQRHEAA